MAAEFRTLVRYERCLQWFDLEKLKPGTLFMNRSMRDHHRVQFIGWLLSCDGGCDPDDSLLADVTIGGARYQKAQMGYHSLVVVQGGYKTPPREGAAPDPSWSRGEVA